MINSCIEKLLSWKSTGPLWSQMGKPLKLGGAGRERNQSESCTVPPL